MTISIISGDLITLAKAGKFDVIVHGANCFCTMKKGIAKAIIDAFPEARDVDLATEKGKREKLGTYSSVQVGDLTIVNAYTQFNWRGKGCKADYDAIKRVFTRIANDFPNQRIGYPKIGEGLAGGDWDVIYPLICHALSGCSHTLVEFDETLTTHAQSVALYSREALQDYVNAGNKVKFVHFWGHRKSKTVTASCFSQWYVAPFTVEGNLFPTAEHYMMYHKAQLFSDTAAMKEVLHAPNAGSAKAIGRQVANFNDNIWREHRFNIVVDGNVAKFSQHNDLREFLLGTGDRVLVEASPKDKIWGIGLDDKHEHANKPNQWKGDNLLGFALMKVRQQFLEISNEYRKD